MSARPGEPRDAGFTLLEMLIALTIVMFALGLASQLLMETAVLFQGSAREARSTPVPQAIARIRADVIASAYCVISTLPDGTMDRLILNGHPAGTVAYQRVGTNLYRIQNSLDAADGDILWEGVDSWMASTVPPGGTLLHVEIFYRQVKGPQFLAHTPGRQGAQEIPRVQSLYALPRGAGLGAGW